MPGRSKKSFFAEARRSFHAALLKSEILRTDAGGAASIADKHSKSSMAFATGMLALMGNEAQGARLAGQMAGNKFEQIVGEFIEETLPKLDIVRPGKFTVIKGLTRLAIANCEQYEHLAAVDNAVHSNRELAAALGVDYLIKPDVMVLREPETDAVINGNEFIVDLNTARKTALRIINNNKPILHASISCKWTLRSDRAQNARSEALNLIRNRKGKLPHIAIVTAEPTPGRLASLALGTGDIDCVYHIALDELVQTVNTSIYDDSKDMLSTMIQGKRLRDIADLPFDLAV